MTTTDTLTHAHEAAFDRYLEATTRTDLQLLRGVITNAEHAAKHIELRLELDAAMAR